MMKFFPNLRNHYSDIYKAVLFLLSIILLVSLFPKEGKFKYEFQKGKPWGNKDLIAPFDFAIQKSNAEIQKEKKLVLDNYHPYFNYDINIKVSKLNDLVKLFEKRWNDEFYGQNISTSLRKTNKEVFWNIADTLLNRGIIELNSVIDKKPSDYTIYVVQNNIAEKKTLGQFFTIQSADDYISDQLTKYENKGLGIKREFLTSLLENSLIQNITYDSETSEKALNALLNNISFTRGMVQQGERIISTGELITPDKFQILESLKKEYEAQLGSNSNYYFILGGQVVLVSMSILVFFLFLISFRKDIYNDNKKLLFILLVIFLMAFATSIVIKHYIDFLYLLPLCLVPIIIRVFFDTRLALFVYLITIIIIGFLVPNSFEFMFLELIAGIITITSIVKLQRRSQFFLTSFYIFISYSVVYIGLTMIQEGSLDKMQSWNFILFGGSAMLTLFSYPFIFLFERLFGFATDVTLMELCDTNSKLMRELAEKTPGTFQHSLQVSNLAEACIHEIGGNSLLVRTGAYYHDIGKIDMPMYFIENQSTGFNPHDELSPEDSAGIIISHVIHGVEKAKRFKLPEQIIDFIRTHHGTRRTEFFFNKQQQDCPNESINEKAFTYHGPIPFSKETSVLMMADSVEAASRTLKHPDEHSISDLVERVINKQIENQQFINSNITLKDITTIKKVLKKKLMNIFHVRITYPE